MILGRLIVLMRYRLVFDISFIVLCLCDWNLRRTLAVASRQKRSGGC